MSGKERKDEGHSTKRRVWDREEYAQKAADREAAQRITELPKRPSEKRKDLEVTRENNLDSVYAEHIGKTVMFGGKGAVPKDLGFYCKVCKCSMKDSTVYTAHMNGKKHQQMLGMSLRTTQATAKDVRERIKENKRKLENTPTDSKMIFDLSVAKSREEEEQMKKKFKLQKQEEKEKKKMLANREPEEWQNEDEKLMAEMMGIPMSFGGSKKT